MLTNTGKLLRTGDLQVNSRWKLGITISKYIFKNHTTHIYYNCIIVACLGEAMGQKVVIEISKAKYG